MNYVLLTVLLLAPMLIAAQIDIRYDINQEVHVTYTATLLQEALSLTLPADATNIRVDGEEQLDRQITLQGTGDTVIEFTTRSLIEGVRNPYFIADLTPLQAEITQVTVYLPARAVLDKPLSNPTPSISPRPTTSGTDGERIHFTWTGQDLEPARAVFVRYDPPQQSNILLTAAIGLLAITLAIAFVATRLKRRVQEKTMNLYGVEEELVHILLEAPEDGMWQNELVAKSGLTKVKVSRKLRNLEQKGVIEKIPHGNTNRIRLK